MYIVTNGRPHTFPLPHSLYKYMQILNVLIYFKKDHFYLSRFKCIIYRKPHRIYQMASQMEQRAPRSQRYKSFDLVPDRRQNALTRFIESHSSFAYVVILTSLPYSMYGMYMNVYMRCTFVLKWNVNYVYLLNIYPVFYFERRGVGFV